MESRLFLDLVVRESAAVLELHAREDQALRIRRSAILVLNFLLYVFNRIARLHIKGDGLARQSLDENLHALSGEGFLGRLCKRG